MNRSVKLSDVISEIMTILTRRREIENQIKEGTANEGDYTELEALNGALQIRDESKKRYGVING